MKQKQPQSREMKRKLCFEKEVENKGMKATIQFEKTVFGKMYSHRAVFLNKWKNF